MRPNGPSVPRDFAPVGAAHDPAFLRGRGGSGLARWRRRLLRKGTIAVLFLVAFVAGALLHHRAGDDGKFLLRQVRIEGSSPARRAALEEALAPALGRDLISLDLAQTRRMLDPLPWVDGAAMVKQLPDTLVVRVRERAAVALVARDGRMQVLAEDGALIGTFDRTHGDADLPVVVGEPTPDDLRRIGAFLGRLVREEPAHFRRIPEIRAGLDGSLVLWDDEAACDLVVDPDGFDDAFPRWLSARAELARRLGPLESADLRFRDRIVLRPVPRENA